MSWGPRRFLLGALFVFAVFFHSAGLFEDLISFVSLSLISLAFSSSSCRCDRLVDRFFALKLMGFRGRFLSLI